MALDFPNSPTLNQTFTAPNGTIWLWDGVKWTAITSTSPYVGGGNVGRNLLHNPLFNVAQRGVGPFTTSVYTLDRWQLFITADTVSVNQQGLADVYRAAIGDEAAENALANAFTGTAGAGSCNFIAQKIENVRRLAGKTVTVSFWALCASGTPKLGVSFFQDYGTGGSPSAGAWLNGQTVTLSPGFTRYSLTFTLPSSSGKTVGTNRNDNHWLTFWYSSGATNNTIAGGIGVQSGTFWLWGAQLEIGSVATPLEKPDPRYDAANCQRFYEVLNFDLSGSAGSGGNGCSYIQPFAVVKRAAPTMTPSGITLANLSGNIISANTGALNPYGVTIAAGGYTWRGNYTASADL